MGTHPPDMEEDADALWQQVQQTLETKPTRVLVDDLLLLLSPPPHCRLSPLQLHLFASQSALKRGALI